MNILVLYALGKIRPRKTTVDSLYCFSRYDKKNHYYYLNVYDINTVKKIGKLGNTQMPLSGIIIHHSMIELRYEYDWWEDNKKAIIKLVGRYSCPKVIFPQDDYNYTDSTREFIKKAGIDYIYTVAGKEDYEKIYPREMLGNGEKHIETIFTGYVDEKTHKKIKKRINHSKRKIDIGYRAMKAPYWLGKHGQLKIELAEAFISYLQSHNTNLSYDIANNYDRDGRKGNAKLGNEWIKYLMQCRTMLGCLGGSGLLDRDGSIAQKVDKYCMEHPEASFEEVEERCFKGLDNYIHLFALSPRHFECAMTKTCQVLVEGDYMGVFKPNVDFIEIKKDFSNLEEVIEKIKDVDYCKEIAENCYKHIVLSGKYTYANFVKRIKSIFKENKGDNYLWKLYFLCGLSKVQAICIYNKKMFIKRLNKFFSLFEPLSNTALYKILSKIWTAIIKKA